MKTTIALVLLQFMLFSILTAQQDSIKFLNRAWYANGYGDKELKIGDTIPFDTTKIEVRNSTNFIMWEFITNGNFNNLNASLRKNVGDTSGIIMVMSDDDVKWELNKKTAVISLDFGIIEGYGNYKATYKILALSQSKLILEKLNKMELPDLK